jgi:hypothetical protein
MTFSLHNIYGLVVESNRDTRQTRWMKKRSKRILEQRLELQRKLEGRA